MNSAARVLAIAAGSAALIPVCVIAAPSSQGAESGPDLIVTAAPVYRPLAALRGQERFPQGAQLLLVHAGKAEPLIAGFAASADANVSFDGTKVLFAGKPAAGDPWEIWELDLATRALRKVIAAPTDAVRPFYLPSGRLVFAERTRRGFQLEVAGKMGLGLAAPVDPDAESSVVPISFLPDSAIPADVLDDGRILFESGFPLGSGSIAELYLVYSDGSGVESYRCDHGRARWGGMQLADGDLAFTHGSSLARFTSPLAHEVRIDAPRAEYAGAMAETASGEWLLSARTGSEKYFALTLWKPGAAALQPLLAESGRDLVEPALVRPRTRPNRHPTALHPWDYANLLALDARLSREGDLKKTPASVRLEAMDADGRSVVTGTAPVEADGSFFVQTPADRPIRFELLDEKGAILRQEHGWFWIRRGEQRICVGCHTGPERSSENRVPAVLQRSTTPADLRGTALETAQNKAGERSPGNEIRSAGSKTRGQMR